ncbi:hypothetical protein PSN45_003309 [Yamadazyma tenuis]|nr:hypothetical protein PSN45_003309 [Yamadazyma tenuis]
MPETSDDYLDLGATEEESGDRWISSDFSKALRFYQRAYDAYMSALSKSANSSASISDLDIHYNISRLLLHVYNQYFQTDGVHINELINVDDVLLSAQSVVQKLPTVVESHERALQLSKDLRTQPSMDLLYNTGVAYTQVLEDIKNHGDIQLIEVMELGTKAKGLFQNLLDRQVTQLQSFVEELDSMGQTSNLQDPSEFSHDSTIDSQNAVGEDTLQPPHVFETITLCYKLSHAILENTENPTQDIPIFRELVEPFLSTCDHIADNLIGSFSGTKNLQSEFLSSISDQQINEYKISKAYNHSLILNDLSEIISWWESSLSTIADIPEKYLAVSDSLQGFLDRNDISLKTCNESNHQEMIKTFWQALTIMTNNLKKAQELMNGQKQALQKSGGDNLGTLVSQLSNVLIARSDIDIQRCQLNDEQAIKNQSILLQNSKVFLKNASTLAGTSGGLRERAVEKLSRKQRQVESVTRLCLLENKTTVEELDVIIGRSRWVREVASLKKLEYFDSFGVQQIQ